ncbi:hypothetical protein BST13_10735 [Mycobacterium aquaticum]|uniref:DUF6398 domain-containing protein n=1 Tax=Mycobacterium aquaticum TaxID=1927124 RepID=A0A1X0B2H4_9MYCO|nr:hypothetical protein BST13_10735 [Mycobacterium aquaticum]
MGRALADPDPLNLLLMVSMLLCITDSRQDNPFTAADHSRPTLEELVESFIGVPCPETTALLAVIAEMSAGNDVLRARIRRELATRPAPEIHWLAGLSSPMVTRVVRMSHELGDGDDIMIAARLASGHEFSCVVYIDHNVGNLVKDAFVLPASMDQILSMSQQAAEDGTRWDDMTLADARAWVEKGIQRATMTIPPFESESWPGCRALVEWVIRTLPTGGVGHQTPEWDSRKSKRLARQFFASQYGQRFYDDEHRDLLDTLLWFGTDYGAGDPLRWSNVKVEMLLADWIPRKVVAPAEHLAKLPDLLRAYVRFAHAEAGIGARWTDEALAAIDAIEPQYQREIRTPGLQSPEALLAQLGIDIGMDRRERKLDELTACVGGHDQLDHLDDTPLPDEPFRWDGIGGDAAPRVRDILALTDRCCEQVLDLEYRTACRRLLARVAANDPTSFGRGRVETVAGAVVWIIGKANNLFRYPAGGMQVKDLMAHFGIQQGGVSQRAATLLRAGGFDSDTVGLRLGSVDYLVSERRRSIIAARDACRGD